MADEITIPPKTRKRKIKKKTSVLNRALRDIVDITLGALLTYFGCSL